MLPKTQVVYLTCAKQLDKWFEKINKEDEPPNPEQLKVLHKVEGRLLDEIELENALPLLKKQRKLKRHPIHAEKP